MTFGRLLAVVTILVLTLAAASVSAKKSRPLNVEDLYKLQRIKDLVVSPYSDHAAIVAKKFDMEENKGQSNIYLLNLANNNVKQLTRSKGSNFMPRWFDQDTLFFVSTRTGEAQIWRISLKGGEPRLVTTIPTGIDNYQIAPDKSFLAVVTLGFPQCKEMPCNAQALKAKSESKVQATIHNELPIRIWDHRFDERREQIWNVPLNGDAPIALTPGPKRAVPLDLGGYFDLSISADSKAVSFTANFTGGPAWNTNNDVFTVPAGGGKLQNVTKKNQASDAEPIYSPDGRYLAYTSMARPGFEADRKVLQLLDLNTQKVVALTQDLDLTVGYFGFSSDSKTIVFDTYERGQKSIYTIHLGSGNINSSKITKIVDKGYNGRPQFTRDGQTVVFLHQNMSLPAEVYAVPVASGTPKKLAGLNDEQLAKLTFGDHEEIEFVGAAGDKVHGFLLKPPGFNPKKKYPLLVLIHGGPQGAFGNDFHFRWNAQMFASPGFVVATINFHGSKGYGQKFCDSVSKDWGGKPYEDIMKGVDWLESTYKFIEKGNVSAAGASYGGFMINWILGHTDRFKSLVSHAGLFDQHSMYGATEELWFPEWEFGGIPWENPELFDKYSPAKHAANFRTPTLVSHGEHDYRVPYTQALQLFTALQRQGVESRLLFFPDETHFVQKPQNAKLWWTTVLDWLASHSGI